MIAGDVERCLVGGCRPETAAHTHDLHVWNASHDGGLQVARPLRWSACVALAPSESVELQSLMTFATACRRGDRVNFTYRDGADRVSDRRVEPHRLVSLGRRWYLVAFDLDRDDWRTYRIDRVSGLATSGHRNTLCPSPDAAALVAEGVAERVFDTGLELQFEVIEPREVIDELRAIAEGCSASWPSIRSANEWPLGYGVIAQPNIMAWSSWARLWQCATYGPTKSRNWRKTITDSPGSSPMTSSLP